MTSRLKDFEKDWVNKVKDGLLDGVVAYRNTEYEGSVFQGILEFEDGQVTHTKRSKVPLFDNKETNREWSEESHVIENDRDLINQLKAFNYNKELRNAFDYSLIEKYKEQKALEKDMKTSKDKIDNNAIANETVDTPSNHVDVSDSDCIFLNYNAPDTEYDSVDDFEDMLIKGALVIVGVAVVGTAIYFGKKKYDKKKRSKLEKQIAMAAKALSKSSLGNEEVE